MQLAASRVALDLADPPGESLGSIVLTALLDLSSLRTGSRVRGIGRYVVELCRALVEQGTATDMRVLGLEKPALFGPARVSSDLAAAVDRLCRPELPEQSMRRWALELRLGLARASRAVAADVVHTPEPRATPIGPLGCPRVTTCHDLIPLRFAERFLPNRLMRSLESARQRLRYQAADQVIAVSESTAHDLVSMLGIDARKISVVYNGIDLDNWSAEPVAADRALRARYGLEEKPYLIYVGSPEWRKNPDGMLAAFSQARGLRPSSDLSFAWVGELPQGELRSINEQAERLGIARSLALLGWVPDDALKALYRGALCKLFVSRWEGFGYPVLEAMASGCPVIASNCSSVAEIAGDAALLVDPEDARAAADGIVLLLDRSSERQDLIRRGVHRAQEFSLERCARETLDVYRRLAQH